MFFFSSFFYCWHIKEVTKNVWSLDYLHNDKRICSILFKVMLLCISFVCLCSFMTVTKWVKSNQVLSRDDNIIHSQHTIIHFSGQYHSSAGVREETGVHFFIFQMPAWKTGLQNSWVLSPNQCNIQMLFLIQVCRSKPVSQQRHLSFLMSFIPLSLSLPTPFITSMRHMQQASQTQEDSG